jgi:protocatechuate 3,4-dioxygenase beta subunit
LSFAVLQKSVVALHLYTRTYFDGEAANAADPVMALV